MNTEEYEKAKQECWEQFYEHVVFSGSQNYEYWFNDVWNQAYNLGMEVAKKEQQSEIQKKTKERSMKISEGRFVVIEDFNDTISLVTDPESGDVLVFDTKDAAEAEAGKCQNGKVVKL